MRYIITRTKRALVKKKTRELTFLISLFFFFGNRYKVWQTVRTLVHNVVHYIRNVNPEQFANIMDEIFEEIDFEIDHRDSDEDSGYASASDFSEHD